MIYFWTAQQIDHPFFWSLVILYEHDSSCVQSLKKYAVKQTINKPLCFDSYLNLNGL